MTDRDRDMRQTRGCSSLLFFIVVPFEALKCLSSHMERESDPQSISGKGFTPWAKGVKLNRPPERNPNVYGEIPGFPVGSTFVNRIECSEAGVHGPWRAGIHGNQHDGAFSVVLSGGYEDDEDDGNTIIYTGQGGRDTKGSKLDQMEGKTFWAGPQSADQEWARGNKALKISSSTKKPIRVVRGYTLNSRYAPAQGYRYDGLYEVVDARRMVGKTGFKTCRFTFQRLPCQPPIPGTQLKTHIKKTGSSKSYPIAKVPSLIPLVGLAKPASAVKRPKSSIGTPRVKKATLDKTSLQSSSNVNHYNRSDLVIPHANNAGPSKLENRQRIVPPPSSSGQLLQAGGLIRRPLAVGRLPMVKMEPIHTLITPRPAPAASLGSIKRRRDDDVEDTRWGDSSDGDGEGDTLHEMKPVVGAMSADIYPSQGGKWATTAGEKKYGGLHFKKKKIEQ